MDNLNVYFIEYMYFFVYVRINEIFIDWFIGGYLNFLKIVWRGGGLYLKIVLLLVNINMIF